VVHTSLSLSLSGVSELELELVLDLGENRPDIICYSRFA
jgi:hypothetical protein